MSAEEQILDLATRFARELTQGHQRIREERDRFAKALQAEKQGLVEELEQREFRILEERSALGYDQARLEFVQSNYEDEVLNLNVGGHVFATRRSTLCVYDGSYLANLFSGRWESSIERDKEGCFFLDFDPYCFQLVLNFLRSRRMESPQAPAPLPKVPSERADQFWHLVEYFGLTEQFQEAEAAASEAAVALAEAERKRQKKLGRRASVTTSRGSDEDRPEAGRGGLASGLAGSAESLLQSASSLLGTWRAQVPFVEEAGWNAEMPAELANAMGDTLPTMPIHDEVEAAPPSLTGNLRLPAAVMNNDIASSSATASLTLQSTNFIEATIASPPSPTLTQSGQPEFSQAMPSTITESPPSGATAAHVSTGQAASLHVFPASADAGKRPPGWSRKYAHHLAIVDETDPRRVYILDSRAQASAAALRGTRGFQIGLHTWQVHVGLNSDWSYVGFVAEDWTALTSPVGRAPRSWGLSSNGTVFSARDEIGRLKDYTSGSLIKFVADMDSRTVSVSIDDEYFPHVYRNLPEVIFPAASNCRSPAEYSITYSEE